MTTVIAYLRGSLETAKNRRDLWKHLQKSSSSPEMRKQFGIDRAREVKFIRETKKAIEILEQEVCV